MANKASGARKILDLGCGIGLGTMMSHTITGAKVVGVDDEDMIDYAQTCLADDNVTFSTLENINANNDVGFDFVLCHDLASFLETQGVMSQTDSLCVEILARVADAMQADGTLFMIAPETLSRLNSDLPGRWSFSTSTEVMDIEEKAGLAGRVVYLSLNDEKRLVYKRFRNMLADEAGRKKPTAVYGACEDGLEISRLIKEAGMKQVGFIDESVDYLENGYEGHKVFHPMEIGSLGLVSIVLPDIRTACYAKIKLAHLCNMDIKILTPFPEFEDFTAKSIKSKSAKII